MRITGYGNASVRIEAGQTALLFDPFLKLIPRGSEPQSRTEQREAVFHSARHILITHGHFDHLLSVAPLYRGTGAEIFCTQTPARTLLRHGLDPAQLHLIQPGPVLTTPEVSVRAFHARHCRFDAGKIAEVIFRHRIFRHFGRLLHLLLLQHQYPAGDECLLYEIAAEDTRVQLLGSAGLDGAVAYPTGADALILPYQGRSDMAAFCVGLVERLRPRMVLLDHYDDSFVPFTVNEDPEPFFALMRRKHPEVLCAALREGEPVKIGRGEGAEGMFDVS